MDKIKVIISGQAGDGVDFAANVLGTAFINIGYYAFSYRYYQSLIRGGTNYNVVVASKEKLYSYYEDEVDYIIAFDTYNLNIHLNKLKKDGVVFGDDKVIYDKKVFVDTNKIIEKYGLRRIDRNIIFVLAFWKYLNLNKEAIINALKNKIDNEELIKKYESIFDELDLKSNINIEEKKYKSRYFISGAEAIALGAIYSGLDIYVAYPMTPSTPIMHFLASLRDKYNIVVYNPSDEIEVINIAAGASYAGAKAMVGSSGGGIDLMAETISFLGMAEIPLVIVWAQRYGPSTGMATHHDQSDLLESLYIGHGEFPRIVISPGDHAEAFSRTIEAFYLAYKFNTVSIILTDLFLLESRGTYDEINYNNKLEISRFLDLNPKEGYKYYEINDLGYKLRTIPGLNVRFKVSSYEHDEEGFETEDFKIGEEMSKKRYRKMKSIEKEINEKINMYELYGEGENLIISWGSNKLSILEAMKHLNGWRYLHISYLNPFPKEVKSIIENSKRVVLIEHNHTSQLGQLIKKEIGLDISDKILKHSGEPFRPEEIVRSLKS